MPKTKRWRAQRQEARTVRHEAKRRAKRQVARRGRKTLPASQRQQPTLPRWLR